MSNISGGRAAIAAVIGAIFSLSAARADTVQIVDISGYTNTSFTFSGLPDGTTTTGNTGNPLASLGFQLLSSTGNNIWLGASTGDTIDIAVSIPNATKGYTLMNSFWGQYGHPTATVEFKATGGVTQSFTLIGGSDVRDYNNAFNTNTINGTTTQAWYNNPTPPQDLFAQRFDAQIYTLAAAFQGQTLTDIVITAGFSLSGYSQPILMAVDVASNPVPLPGALPLFTAGLVGLGWLARRRRQAA